MGMFATFLIVWIRFCLLFTHSTVSVYINSFSITNQWLTASEWLQFHLSLLPTVRQFSTSFGTLVGNMPQTHLVDIVGIGVCDHQASPMRHCYTFSLFTLLTNVCVRGCNCVFRCLHKPIYSYLNVSAYYSTDAHKWHQLMMMRMIIVLAHWR